MPQVNQDILSLIGQLQHKSSPKRRAAAKKLRKLKAKESGPTLLVALKNELKDKRTWETQYQMIMALGEVGYTESLNFLLQLVDQEFEATMIYVALGDAIVRIIYSQTNSISNVIKYLNSNHNPLFIDGLIRATAILKLIPSEKEIEQIINYGNQPHIYDNNRTWIASAAAGWDGNKVKDFLNKCLASENQQTKRAAKAALNKKYIKWSIL